MRNVNVTADLRSRIGNLYNGDGRAGKGFRWSLFLFDIAVLGYFLWTATRPITGAILAIDLALGALMMMELGIRLWIADDRRTSVVSLSFLIDIVVIASLFAPLVFENLAFLRILRALRFMHSYRTAEELTAIWPWFSRNRHVVMAATNLVVFVFMVTSVVWVLEHKINDQINTWIDALYFTVTTLTTTGFGDIILKDDLGRLLTVLIMVFGVALFLRLVQQIFRPSKVNQTCPHCGLRQHDPDASHCKHCGNVIYIETEGET